MLTPFVPIMSHAHLVCEKPASLRVSIDWFSLQKVAVISHVDGIFQSSIGIHLVTESIFCWIRDLGIVNCLT